MSDMLSQIRRSQIAVTAVGAIGICIAIAWAAWPSSPGEPPHPILFSEEPHSTDTPIDHFIIEPFLRERWLRPTSPEATPMVPTNTTAVVEPGVSEQIESPAKAGTEGAQPSASLVGVLNAASAWGSGSSDQKVVFFRTSEQRLVTLAIGDEIDGFRITHIDRKHVILSNSEGEIEMWLRDGP